MARCQMCRMIILAGSIWVTYDVHHPQFTYFNALIASRHLIVGPELIVGLNFHSIGFYSKPNLILLSLGEHTVDVGTSLLDKK